MNRGISTCSGGIAMLTFSAEATAQIEVSGIAHSQATDLNAVPNSVDDYHTFDNTTAATALTPSTTSSTVTMAHGSASGTVTASEGLFRSLATSYYANTGLNEDSQTDTRANASDSATITSATLPLNTPVTLRFALNATGTLTSPNIITFGEYGAFATAFFASAT